MLFRRPPTIWLVVCILVTLAGCNSASDGASRGQPDPDAGKLVVSFLETPDKHGLAIVLRTPSNKTYVIDTGWLKDDYDAGRDTIAPYLRAQGVNRIEAIVLSHPHRDHFGGTNALLDEFAVRQLIDSGYDARGTTEEYRDLRRRAVALGVDYRTVQAGSQLKWDKDLEVEVLSPPAQFLGLDKSPSEMSEHALLNINSVVLRVRHGNIVFLLPGDAYGQESMYLLTNWPPEKHRATILAAPHHGFNATDGFARAVRPEVVVVSSLLYYGNSSIASPPDEMTRVFAPVGSKIYATPWHGTVRVVSDGVSYKVGTQRTRTDVAPPTVATVGATTDVLTDGTITVNFSEPVICDTINASTFTIAGLTGTITCSGATATFKPAILLANGQTYTATIVGGALGVRDVAGNALATNFRWSFTTIDDFTVPTAAGAALLFRYPYLQAESARRMRILWATTQPGTCSVRYRSAADLDWLVQSACSEEAFTSARTGLASDFYQHEVVLDGLRPGSKYVYDVLHNGETIAKSVPMKTFNADRNQAVQFIAFADSGVGDSIPRRIRDRILSRDGSGLARYPFDFAVGLGDLAYDNGTFAEFDRNFFNQLSGKGDQGNGRQSLLISRPFVPVLGNHEFGSSAANVPAGYLASFSLPTPASAPLADAERYYSFDAGDGHFVVIDSMKFVGDVSMSGLASMLAWLDADLAATDRRWRIVFLHHAVFSYGLHGVHDGLNNDIMRRQLVPMLQRHGVQLVMFGHDHMYQRSKRILLDSNANIVRDAACKVVESASGIVYVVAGNAGTALYTRQTGPSPCGSSSLRIFYTGDPSIDYVATHNNQPALHDASGLPPTAPGIKHGFVHVTVFGPILVGTAYNYNGEVLDQFTLDTP